MPLPYQLDNSLGYVYEKMADHIELRIKSGDLKPGTPLPAERRLADDYAVSLGTARRATELLRERRLVVTLRSKGTFVLDYTSAASNVRNEPHSPLSVVPISEAWDRSGLGGG